MVGTPTCGSGTPTSSRSRRRFDDALDSSASRRSWTRLSVLSSWQMADTLFLAGRWEDSLAQSYHTLELDPTHSWSFRTIGQSLDALGKREEAIEAYLKAGNVASGHLGRVYALMGRRSAAREILATLPDGPEKGWVTTAWRSRTSTPDWASLRRPWSRWRRHTGTACGSRSPFASRRNGSNCARAPRSTIS